MGVLPGIAEKYMHSSSGTPPERDGAEVTLTGLRIAPGLGRGSAWVVGDRRECRGDAHPITPHEVEREWSRIRVAFDPRRVPNSKRRRGAWQSSSMPISPTFSARMK